MTPSNASSASTRSPALAAKTSAQERSARRLEVLHDPHPPALVEVEEDGLADDGLGEDEFDFKIVRNDEGLRSLGGAERMVLRGDGVAGELGGGDLRISRACLNRSMSGQKRRANNSTRRTRDKQVHGAVIDRPGGLSIRRTRSLETKRTGSRGFRSLMDRVSGPPGYLRARKNLIAFAVVVNGLVAPATSVQLSGVAGRLPVCWSIHPGGHSNVTVPLALRTMVR